MDRCVFAISRYANHKQILLHPENLTGEEISSYRALINRRAHEPCQYLTGRAEFFGLSFVVNKNVLIPRQDTEVLVEEVLGKLPAEGSVLDLCTGSGAIAIAIKHRRPDCTVTATDISEAALKIAEQNGEHHECRIRFLRSDLFEQIEEEEAFDVIVSNPPYVSDREYEKLMPEVKDHEPPLALKAGRDGLDFYRRLIADAPEYLKSGGRLMVEIGSFQRTGVSGLFASAGFTDITVQKDLAGFDRVVCGKFCL